MGIKAKLGTFDTTMIVVSLIIGIGIFRTPAMVAAAARTPFLFFAAWVLGGFVSFLGALTFAEIGSRFPKPGSFYQVVAENYGSLPAFLLNWTNIIIQNGVGIAAAAIIGAEYLAPLFTGGRTPGILTIQLTAAGLVLVLLVINFLGIRSGAWAQNVLSLLKVAMIAVLSAAAFRPGTPQVPAASLPLDGSWVFALGIAFISVFYSYGGYQNTINFGADVKDPSRSIPRAIFFGMSIVVACYLAVNVAYFRVLGMAGVASSKLVAAETARAAFGGTGGTIISLAIFLSAMGYLNVTLMQMPRAYYAMAADRTLPAFFMKVNPRTQTQEPGLLFLGGLILGSIFFLGTFESIINYVMFVDPITIAVVASTVFVLRRKAARGGIVFRGYRVPLYPLLPALFIIFELAVSVNVLLSRPKEALYGTIILAAGLPIFLIMRRVSGKTAAGDAGKTGDMGSSTGTAEG